MSTPAVTAALASPAVFCALVLMSDRKRGAAFAQAVLTLAVALVFVVIVVDAPIAGFAPREVAAIAVGLISASVAGMLYHLYLGRFTRAWAARGVFTAVYLGLSVLFGLVFLSLI